MEKIIFATNNSHKLDEIRRILAGRFEILSLADVGISCDIPENEPTLEGNALCKARFIYAMTGTDCFADDTGLEVEALGGEPGVRSARYAPGDGHDSRANMELLLHNMKGASNRKARFRTVMALIRNGQEQTVEGIVNGRITEVPAGKDGFGYDPVFIPEDQTLTFAEMTPEQKNSISHRARAAAKLVEILK